MYADHGDRVNDMLRKRYSLEIADLPKFLLFKRGRSVEDPIRYNGKFEEKALIQFLRDRAFATAAVLLVNLRRVVIVSVCCCAEGLYVGQHGCLEAMEKLALEFKDAAGEKDKRQDILSRAKSQAATYSESQDKTSAGVYLRLLIAFIEYDS